jgi:hypothetical protein
MSGQSFVNYRKDEETIRLQILTNVCRMMVLRGNLDISKYCHAEFIDENFNNINIHLSSIIDNTKFEPMIGQRSDRNTYIIDIDIPFEDETKSNNFDGTRLIVSIIPQKIKDIKNSDMINEIFKRYPTNHKLFIVDEIIDKASIALTRAGNVEVFIKDNITIDLMSYQEAPHRCTLDKTGAGNYIVRPNIPRMHENDPLSKYYNGKIGDTLQIIGNTVTNCFERRYRRIIEPKAVFN